jgi:SRSO17 transposase
MLERSFRAGVLAAWVTGDEVYGNDGNLRRWLEGQEHSYVLAVRSNQSVWVSFHPIRVDALAGAVPNRAWRTITIAAGSKGLRRYSWAWIPVDHDLAPGWQRWLLIRKSLEDGEMAFYLAAGPDSTTLASLARVAGARWSIEAAFESAKQEVGLADYEVRSWTGWYRHVTLSLLAHAVLAVLRKVAGEPPKKTSR